MAASGEESGPARATTCTLSSGATMPLLGLGTWKSKPGAVEAAVLEAIKAGYRHIDCAKVYGNEKEVGAGLKQAFDTGLVKREDMFITSKLWNNDHHPEDVMPALKSTLEDLGLAYVDLYLIHWPIAFVRGKGPFPKQEDGTMEYSDDHYLETWKVMEKAVAEGLVKSIGVSNFNSRQLKEVIDAATVKPTVLQIESHPYLTQTDLIKFCADNGVVVTAYSPLGSPDRPWAKADDPALLQDPKLLAIAERVGKTPAQVLIRFQTQRGVVCIPKSVTPARIAENFNTLDFDLTDEDVATLSAFNQNWRACIPAIERDGKMVPRDTASPFFPWGENDKF